MSTNVESVMAQLQRVVNQVLLLNKKSVFTYGDVEFFPSEVHLMLVIDDGNATNATRMAEALGVRLTREQCEEGTSSHGRVKSCSLQAAPFH